MSKKVWYGFEQIDFLFEGREAILIVPEQPNTNRNWLLKTEYFGAFPALETELLNRGWHIAFIQNDNRWAEPEDVDRKVRFAEFVSKEFALDNKCALVGMSCGGLYSVRFACAAPHLVSALYLDAPPSLEPLTPCVV